MSSHSQPLSSSARKPITLHRLRELYTSGEKLTMLTCYDATFARVLDEAGVEMLLVGDSLGMVLQGRASTLPVTIEEMAYHVKSVIANGRYYTLETLVSGPPPVNHTTPRIAP